VIMQSINFGGFLEKHGVAVMIMKSDKHKDIMYPARDMNKEENKIMQSMDDKMYDEDIDVVEDGDDMDECTVRKLADGRVYTGKQAEENGLVYEVGTYDDSLAALKDDYDLEGAAVTEYNNNLDCFTSFGASMNNLFNKDNLNLDTI